MTVLIVDDSSIMRTIIKDILEKFAGLRGVDIHEAADGRDAISKFSSLKPDLVFLDISMPDVDGITAVSEMIKINPSANIIMCTASSDQIDVQNCIAAGAKEYIIKPPRPEKVMQAFNNIRTPK